MSANYISPKMRLAAPEQCAEIDELRARRRPLADRLRHQGASEAEGVTTSKQQIVEIDSKVDASYAGLLQQYRRQVASDLAHGATMLQVATMDAGSIRVSMAEETQQHSDAMLLIVYKLEEL